MTTKTQLLTITDWEAMPHGDGNRYETIEGELFVSCSPDLTHQIVLTRLIVRIGNFLDTNPIGTLVAGPGLILSNYSGVVPDLVFFRHDQHDEIVDNDRLTGPPALVIEIVSPGSTNNKRDRIVKLRLYAKHGVPEYWIVDPQKLTIERYLDHESSLALFETLHEQDTLVAATLPGFSCRVGDIFGRQF